MANEVSNDNKNLKVNLIVPVLDKDGQIIVDEKDAVTVSLDENDFTMSIPLVKDELEKEEIE